MHSQRIASIAPIVIVIGCIDYLAYGAIWRGISYTQLGLKVREPFWIWAFLVCDYAPVKKGSHTNAFPTNSIHHAYCHQIHWLSSLQSYFYVCDVSENKTWCFFARKAADERGRWWAGSHTCRMVVCPYYWVPTWGLWYWVSTVDFSTPFSDQGFHTKLTGKGRSSWDDALWSGRLVQVRNKDLKWKLHLV